MTIAALFGGDPEGTKAALFRAMHEHGATMLEASYSGGNDEGGVDEIKLFDNVHNPVFTPGMWITREPKEGEHAYSQDGLVHEYHPLYEAVDNVLSLEYGSWAGEFSAWGTLFADSSTREVRREGSIETPSDEDDSGYF